MMRKLLGQGRVQLDKAILKRKSFVNSYGVTLQKAGIQRVHGQLRYDENYYLTPNNYYLKQMVNQEKKDWAEVEQQLAALTQSYQEPSEKRIDPRHGDLPEEYDHFLYFSRLIQRKNQTSNVFFRQDSRTKEETELFDLLELPRLSPIYRDTVQLVKMQVSPDHRYIALGIDKRNDEQVEFYFKDLNIEKGPRKNLQDHPQYLRDRIRDCSDVLFMAQQEGVFYVEYDHNRRNCRVKTHIFGQPLSTDTLIYQESDEAFSIGMHQTKDQKYIVISSLNKTVSEVHVLDKESGRLSKVLDKSVGHNLYLNHDADKWVSLRDRPGEGAVVQVKKDSSADWIDVYQCEKDQSIQEIDVFKGLVVLYIQSCGGSLMKIVDTSQEGEFPVRQVQLDTQISNITPGINQSYSPRAIRFHVHTPFSYNMVYEYDLALQKVNLLEGFRLLGPAFDASQFSAYQINLPASDGVDIPVTLVHKKGLQKDRTHRLLLHVYGFYGLPCESSFSIVNLQALQNGWVLAYAHVRGGAEKGVAWHQQGQLEHKHKSYSDFISVAQGLIMQGYTHNALLAAYGASAGASVVAQGLNTHPQLFQGAVLSMPFLEVLGTLLDPSQALVHSDHQEWGDPQQSLEVFQRIRDLCPYENLQNNNYPSVYLVLGEDDFRSPVSQAMKYVRRLRERRQKENRRGEVYVRLQEGGHMGGVGVDNTIKEQSLQFALLDHLLLHNNQDVTVHRVQEETLEKINED